MKKLLFFFYFLTAGMAFAQQNVSGTITDSSGIPIPGVNILEKGTSNGVTSNFDGKYSISINQNAALIFSYVGYATEETLVNGRAIIDITMSDGEALDAVVLVGSRSPKRTAVDTAVAIDVIDIAEVSTQIGKVELNQMLQYAAPSFNANKQSGSDGADHIDPASLRGLGPDQTLVLINGKRRHQSSLINIFGTRGKGNTGTDLNAIPTSAIKRIEILRDGASAQYGSDAIAGVINIVLKDKVDELTGTVSYGTFLNNPDGDFPTGTPNTDGFRLDTDKDGNVLGEDKDFDGASVKVTANYGFKIADEGYANFTTEYLTKNKTLRPGYDFRKGFGEAAIDGFNFFGNLAIPLAENTEFYAFGGRNFRDTDAYAFTRNNPTERIVQSIYPNGFTPRITSIILDNSISAGIRTTTDSGWKVDISNTYGKNNFHYFIKGTLNASLGDASPTDFDAGGHSLSQNTINLDFSKYYDNVLSGMSLAFGTEYRTENFIIFAGEENSWGTYDTNGLLIVDSENQTQSIDPVTGQPRPGGSQGFPGYSPDNEINRSRSNLSLYADAEFDLSESFLLSTAARFENYSDFGSAFNGKLAARLKATNNINIRGSLSSGFRAPSLAQIYYNLRFTNFSGGTASESLLSPNNSPITASFGIEQLNEEKALNASLGFTAKFGDFTATVDGYYINIEDRIVLTGNFPAPQIDNVETAQFFVNGVDTKTTGLDIILSWKNNLDNDSSIGATFLANINDMKIESINNKSLDEATFFGPRDRAFLLASAPDNKLSLNLNYNKKWFDTGVSITRFSDIELVDYGGAIDYYEAKIVTDLNLGFELSENLKLNVGGNNLLNVYPDQQGPDSDSGGYWDAVQMGFSGSYYYANLNFKF
ncbi:TonB-dependent receptor [Flavivirga aquatica]|uniref:TonB-dependent receptor n=1 Tax=Flavivirga aquatica TaxID=1849968 RepID=A0A1E5T8P6_9FLAO|nr:TonB-dependent receptor [Flavivirga aquatica]OEK07716.1 TonB-dependent receptor [Flavivirga aquatica]